MKKSGILFILFAVVFLAGNLVAASQQSPNIKKSTKEKNGSVAYLGLEKRASDVKTTDKNKKNVKDTDVNVSDSEKKEETPKSVVYYITGGENKLINSKYKSIFDVDGRELYNYSKSLAFTKYQQAQVDYLELERRSKIFALDREISIRRKMLDEELANDMYDVFVVEEIARELKNLVVDKETVNLNIDKKLRYVLDSEQYLKYKRKKKRLATR
ncbi:hypothetical protein [Candidatus Ruminimicrobiellum ovillum]|uniref:hypothetical protein n=1 Tax=Candidatus Ruminimicrobiellum ovillum TaxID=1947927 RepID=UPI00355A52E9